MYAVVLAGQLRRNSSAADRVLLLGPGKAAESASCRRALVRAGWAHLVAVEAVDTPHLDKTGLKRHRYVFTKLRALQLPYERVLLLDLDILPRDAIDFTALFQVPAPAGKYHGVDHGNRTQHRIRVMHGKPLPEEAQHSWWCANVGVLRLDPCPSVAERQKVMDDILQDLDQSVDWQPTYLPEQYYLAQRLTGWRHISFYWNHEVSLGVEFSDQWAWYALRDNSSSASSDSEIEALDKIEKDTKVWHYSGKSGMQPWMFQDFESHAQVKEWLLEHWNMMDPGGIATTAFAEWRRALQCLLDEPFCIGDLPDVHAALERLAQCAAYARRDCDYLRVRKLAWNKAEGDATFAKRRRWEKDGQATFTFTFDEFATYERTVNDLEPGPRGDQDAIRLAETAWMNSRSADEDDD